jgi:hypothetical protein
MSATAGDPGLAVRRRRRVWAVARWTTMATHVTWGVTTGLAIGVDVEAIVGGAMVIVPLAIAAAATGYRSGLVAATMYGLVTVGVCVMVFGWVFLWEIPPRRATWPVGVVGVLYGVGGLAMVGLVWRSRLDRLELDPRVCVACGYWLEHLTGDRCPECGERFDPDAVRSASEAAAERPERGL